MTDLRSKKAAGRPRDQAALEIPLRKPRATRKATLEALKRETELGVRDQIRRLLALPPQRRPLLKRVGIRVSCLCPPVPVDHTAGRWRGPSRDLRMEIAERLCGG